MIGLNDLLMLNKRWDDFSNVDFKDADLSNANLNNCDLRGANLSRCRIDSSTCFEDAIFDENTKMLDYPMACPLDGEFIGWKRAMSGAGIDHRYVVVQLLIPADAKRSSSTGRKCRCDKAKVLSIFPFGLNEAHSLLDARFIYKVGHCVSVDNFDECRWHECAPGIHFFMTKEEAANYRII